MYCKNCSKEMDPNAVICINCGVKAGDGAKYCQNCGNETMSGAAACVNCGAALTPSVNPATQKSKIAAGVLGILLGSFGIHNFYLGFTGKAVAQLLISILSCGTLSVVSGIWGLIEGIMILTGSINADATGTPLKD